MFENLGEKIVISELLKEWHSITTREAIADERQLVVFYDVLVDA